MKIIVKYMDGKKEQMEFIKDSFQMIKGMEMVNSYGITDKYLMENGETVKRMDMVFGNLQRVIIIKDNGKIIVKKVKAIISIFLLQHIKVHSKVF